MNGHNFFFAAFDPGGFISVDKPPVALWLQVLSVKLLGFRPFALQLPQVLEGAGSVWLLHHLVRRRFSAASALLAAFFFATAPVWVAVNRTNNVDSCLVLVLLLAGWALLKAAEQGDRRFLLVSAACVGVAFNVKMLAACLVLPGFAWVYLLGGLSQWKRRALDLGLAGAVVIAVSLPWLAAFQATPADQRPYAGSSRGNSMLELVVGHNALGRFTRIKAQVGPARPAMAASGAKADARQLLRRLFPSTPPGPFRLFRGQFAAQTGWLLPLALAGLLLGGALLGKPDPKRLSLWFWLAWGGTSWIVYSCLGGIVHFYYLATLAPALAALAGIGVTALWERNRKGWLPAALALTMLWQLHVQSSAMDGAFPGLSYLPWAMAAGVLLASSGLACARSPWLARGWMTLGLAALMVLPSAWALSSVLAPAPGTAPSADLQRLAVARRDPEAVRMARFGQTSDTASLVGFLQARRRGESFLLATSTTQWAAPIIIATGEPVMARGGFHGLDGAVDPDQMARFVRTGQVRFAMLGDVAPVSRRLGATDAGRPVADWIRAHGRRVDRALWAGTLEAGGAQLYDLDP